MTKKFIPAVSIIIPMYNTEKYIGECLDSILAQTFTDFEVIVVDDCSTDNSATIVEKYTSKFNTRGGAELYLIKSELNSGCPATPRNIGMRFARGEYLMFVDSDDAITNTALEELYTIAKKFDADVIHCEKFYRAQDNIKIDKPNLKIVSNMKDFVSTPALMPENIIERIVYFSMLKFDWSTWLNFIRRDFVMKNNLEFPDYKVCEDAIFAIFCLCLAKKIVRVPNVAYIYRARDDSATQFALLSAEEKLNRWGDFFLRGIPLIDKFMNKLATFKDHAEYKYAVYNLLMDTQSAPILNAYAQIPAFRFEKWIRTKIETIENGSALTAFLFSRANLCNLRMIQQQNFIRQQQQQIQQLQEQLQKLKLDTDA